MKHKLPIFTTVAIFLFIIAACAPSKTFVITTPEYEARLAQTNHIGIIDDVCLQYDPLFKKDYVLLENSRAAAKFMAYEAKDYLAQKGYTVDFTASPFVGSFFPYDTTYRFTSEKRGEISLVSPPFYFDETDSVNKAFMDAMLNILNEVHYVMSNNYNPLFSTDPTLKNELQTIAARTGQDKILFSIGNGAIVPLGKTILEGVTLGVLTALVTGGLFTYYINDYSWLDSYLMLIDLNTGEVLWSNFMRITGDYADTDNFYKNTWVKNLLYYYPPREGFVVDEK